MTQLYCDFIQARQNMVENQLRPAEVNDIKLIEIMRILPREKCVDESQRAIAYSDINIPLIDHRVLTEPRVMARLVQLASIKEGQKVLIIGAGTGYLAAIISLLGAKTYALEENNKLAERGKKFCNEYAAEVHWYNGKLCEGLPEIQYFDVILIDGAVTEILKKWVDQLSKNGHIVTVLKKHGETGYAVIAKKTAEGCSIRSSFYAALPVLPELI